MFNLNPREVRTKDKKATVNNNTSELYYEYLGIFFNQYITISEVRKRRLGDNYDPENLFLDRYDYFVLSKTEKESTDQDESTDKNESIDKEESVAISNMQPLEGDEEKVEEGKRFKTLTPNKLSTRPPILLPQIKAGNNSNKLDKHFMFCISTIKSTS